MRQNLTRREFVKNAALGLVALGLLPYESVFAAGATDADLVVYGKIFTSEGNSRNLLPVGCIPYGLSFFWMARWRAAPGLSSLCISMGIRG